MKETILITGANSLIAQRLIPLLSPYYNIKSLTRKPQNEHEYIWDTQKWTIDPRALDDVNYIIHLSGAKLNDGTPLTPERKKLVRDSRIEAANFLRRQLKNRNQKIASFISASAIGYYGFQDNELHIDENGAKGIGFSAELSADWEAAASLFKKEGIAQRVVQIRVSLVLGNKGGIYPMYEQMAQQSSEEISQIPNSYIPWNHIEDMAGIFAHAVTHQLDGIYNSVAPEPASMKQIIETIKATKENTYNAPIG